MSNLSLTIGYEATTVADYEKMSQAMALFAKHTRNGSTLDWELDLWVRLNDNKRVEVRPRIGTMPLLEHFVDESAPAALAVIPQFGMDHYFLDIGSYQFEVYRKSHGWIDPDGWAGDRPSEL
jgi:hypothetical protein